RGGPPPAPDFRAGARLLAPVLPEPARIAGDRRNRRDRRDSPPRGAWRGAPEARRRRRPGRRPARARRGRQEGQGPRADRLAGGRDRPGDRGLAMRAVNLLPGDDARRSHDTPNLIVLISVLVAVVLTAVLAGGFLLEHSKGAAKEKTLNEKKDELASIPPPPSLQVDPGAALVSDKSQRK